MEKNTMIKSVSLSQIKEDLTSGLTKWKKDDIGFGSLEKKYQLTLDEMVKLTAHPKVQVMETRIPTFTIVDDLGEPEIVQPEARIEVPSTVERETRVEVKQQPKEIVKQQINNKPATLTTFI